MTCSQCGSHNCQLINKVTSRGKDFSLFNACLGFVCLGPVGVLCGLCGEGRVITNSDYWVCSDCGARFKADIYDI